MIEAAIGVELSRSTFSNGKRHITVKGKENENDKAVNTVSQQATKRTDKDHAPVGGIDGVADTTHIGGIFRSAAAPGIDAVLLARNSCDPLNGRAIRVSMDNMFLIPWTWLNGSLETLHELGFKTVTIALTDKSIASDDPDLNREPRLAIVMGTEGDGLPQEAIDACDYTVRIPMAYGVDSLNVNAAAAVAFWQLRIK